MAWTEAWVLPSHTAGRDRTSHHRRLVSMQRRQKKKEWRFRSDRKCWQLWCINCMPFVLLYGIMKEKSPLWSAPPPPHTCLLAILWQWCCGVSGYHNWLSSAWRPGTAVLNPIKSRKRTLTRTCTHPHLTRSRSFQISPRVAIALACNAGVAISFGLPRIPRVRRQRTAADTGVQPCRRPPPRTSTDASAGTKHGASIRVWKREKDTDSERERDIAVKHYHLVHQDMANSR